MSDTTDSRKEKFDSTYHDNFVKAVQRFVALYQGNSDKPAFEKCSFMLSHLFEKPGTNLFETLKFEDLVIIHKLLAEQNYDIKLLSWCLDKCTNVDLVVKPDVPFPTYSVVFTFTVNEGARITLTHNVVHGVIDSVSLNDHYGANLRVYPDAMTFIDALYSFYHGTPQKESKAMSVTPKYLTADLNIETHEERTKRLKGATNTIFDILSNDVKWTEDYVHYIARALRVRNYFNKFNASNFAKHLGLELKELDDKVYMNDYEVGTVGWFTNSYTTLLSTNAVDALGYRSDLILADVSTMKRAYSFYSRRRKMEMTFEVDFSKTLKTRDKHPEFSVTGDPDLTKFMAEEYGCDSTKQEYEFILLDYLEFTLPKSMT